MTDRNTRTTPLTMLLALVAAAGTALAGSYGEVRNAELRRLRVEGDLARQLDRLREATGDAVWVSWTTPVVDGDHTACCFDRHDRWKDRVCRLESRDRSWSHSSDDVATGAVDLRVLLRLEDGEIDEVRAYTTDCALDAGGRPFYEAENVGPAESARYLASLIPVDRKPRGHVADGALMTVALHGDGEADRVMTRLTRPEVHPDLRGQAAFWLGVARGRPGFERLREMLRDDPSEEVKEHVVFGISQSDVDGAADLLVATARRHRSSEVRSKALFWLAQMAGERARDTLREAVHDDPDAEVREQAVFALSQLPRDEGVPLLIDLARTSRHPEVRKSAMFWLGQSGDPRALELFEEILSR